MKKIGICLLAALTALLCGTALAEGPALPGLTWESSMELVYASCFSVDYYEGGYALIDVKGDARYLVVPEDMEAPQGLDADIVVLQQPVENIYLAATSSMAASRSLRTWLLRALRAS